MSGASLSLVSQAQAQAAPPPNLVNACAGVSLPRSVVTDILTPVVNGVVTPLQNTVNPILGVVGAVLPLVPPLNIDAAGLLNDAATGQPITLQVLNTNGTVVGPTDQCDSQADSFTLANPKGISIGGNRITGLGTTGLEASAGELNSVAFGNSATTDATAANSIAVGPTAKVLAGATGSVALGSNASVAAANSVALGANSTATRGAVTGYTALGLAGLQNSAGEVSIGAAGAPRQLTNVAAGTAATDAANVGQLTGVSAAVDALADTAVQYDTAAHDRVTLTGAGGTVIGNLAPGTLSAASTEAVNGSQLYATNQNVAGNTTLITNLTNNVTNGGIGPVQYSNFATPTTPNGGIPSNNLTLVGATAAPVALHNVADGTIAAGSTDGVNGGQVFTLQGQIAAVGADSVQYDGPDHSIVTLGGANGTTLTNVTAGALGATSTDAVNGSQLNATNVNVTNLTNNVTNGGIGPVQYSNFATPTTPNGGIPSNNLTLVGATAAPVALHNIADGTIAAGSTDGVNGGQVFTLQGQIAAVGADSVQYDGPDHSIVTLGGANGTTLTNVTAGGLGTTSTDAVNGSQLYATNQNVAGNTTLITNLTNNVTNGGIGPVQYSNFATPTTPNGGIPSNNLTLVGATAAPVALHNVADGTIAAGSTDGVNGGQVFSLQDQIAAGDANSVQYDGPDHNIVTFGGANGTLLTNVTAGALGATSTDAVNGSQLYATNVNVTNLTTSITNGAIGPIQYANAATPTVPNGGVPTNDLTLVGATAAPVALHNIADGTIAAGSTDGVNGGQVFALQGQIATVGANSVQYDGADHSSVTLGGANGTTISNVAAGELSATSTQAVNGAQLNATNQNVANNTTAITNLGNTVTNLSTSVTNLGDQISNGGIGPVQYSNPGTPTTPNGGVQTNDLTLVGAAPGAVALHNVGDGSITAGSTDAVNGGQVYALSTTVANAVTYTTDAQGNRTNTVNLVGGNAAAPVVISNVGAGTLSNTSTEAVNGSQLYATNQNVATVTNTANTALTLGQNSVQYDESRTSITLNSGGASTTIHNVAAGTSPTDAVNVAQLNNGINNAISVANQYTDARISALNFDLRDTRRDASAGTAGALAAAGLPQAYESGKGMIAVSMGVYQDQTAVAVGFSKAFNDGHTVVKMGGTWDSRSHAGASTGVGYQF